MFYFAFLRNSVSAQVLYPLNLMDINPKCLFIASCSSSTTNSVRL
jgi:hypothetical protein